MLRTVVADGEVVGNAAVYGVAGEREVTYWIDRAYLGPGRGDGGAAGPARRGDRTAAVRQGGGRQRRLRCASCGKCGFCETARARGYAGARGREIEEVVLVLGAS